MEDSHQLPDPVKRYYNKAQRISMSMRAHIEVWVVARAGGKTRGIIAPRLAHNAWAMKRSHIGYVVPTLKQFKRLLAQSLLGGLIDLGYVEGRHFVVGQRPPKKWPRAYNSVLDYEFSMSFSSGSSVSFLSQQGGNTGVGGSFDATINDESRLTDVDRFDTEYLPAVRGNVHHFGGLPEHFSLLLATDRPMNRKGRWIYRYEPLVDNEQNALILGLHEQQTKLKLAVASGSLSPSTMENYTYRINGMQRHLNALRSGSVYYGYANVLDNIHNLSMEWLLEREATVPDRVFRAAYLNEDVREVSGSFYAGFDETRHGYWPSVNGKLHAAPIGSVDLVSSDYDFEISPNTVLDIAMDYGSHINCIVVGQQFADRFRVDNAMHCLHPEITVDVVNSFIRYYASHTNKRVNYYIDNTARNTGGQSQFSYEQIVTNTLRSAGWDVNVVYLGKQPAPELRYQMWARYFSMDEPPVVINMDNCDDLITSMRLCEVQEGRNGALRKNKSAEGKGDIDDEVLLPHYSDALDTLVWGRTMRKGGSTLPTPSIMM